MDELWVITVGRSDVQFPIWRQDEYGGWTTHRRFEVGKSGTRRLHEVLLELLRRKRVAFERPMPAEKERDVEGTSLSIEHDGEFFIAQYNCRQGSAASRLIATRDEASSDDDEMVPVLCPKVEPLRDLVLQGHPDPRKTLSVLVLNTERQPHVEPEEPIAAGPLVANWLAKHLGLEAVPFSDGVPAAGYCTWLNVLEGDEQIESPEARNRLTRRMTDAFAAWEGRRGNDWQVSLSASGGLPVDRDATVRLAASFFGEEQVRLLEAPPRGPARSMTLGYSQSWSEQLALRFYCLEALRRKDLVVAFGLLARIAEYGEVTWARQALAIVGPLLGLGFPVGPGIADLKAQLQLLDFELTAAQIEASLVRGDVEAAAPRLGVICEQIMWHFIEKSPLLRNSSIAADRAEEKLAIQSGDRNAREAAEKLTRDGLLGDKPRTWGGKTYFKVDKLLQPDAWVPELKRSDGWDPNMRAALDLTTDLLHAYYDRKGENSSYPRDVRNRVVHGGRASVDTRAAAAVLKRSGLVAAMERPFGENFLQVSLIRNLLGRLNNREPALEDAVRKTIEELHDRLRKNATM